MKILFISPSPPNELERIRSLNILKCLKENNAKVTLITLYNNKQNKYLKEAVKYVEEIIPFRYSKVISIFYSLISLFLPIPVRVGYCFNFRLRHFLKKFNKEFDAVYIKRLRMAQYSKYFNKSKTYIDITDSLTKYYERLYRESFGIKKIFYFEEYIKLKRYETNICMKNKNIIICSYDDKEYLEKISNIKKDKIKVLENVIDLKSWYTKNILIREKRTRLVFFGVMNYKPNIMAVKYLIKEIMPKLDKEFVLDIIGPKVPNSLLRLENERIRFLGYVKSVKEQLKEEDIFISPIKVGAGVKNKILQAGAYGIPIICTSLSLEGITMNLNETIYLANTIEEFIKRIKEVNEENTMQLKNRLELQRKIIIDNNELDIMKKKLLDIIIK